MPDEEFSPIALTPRDVRKAPPLLLMTGLDSDIVYPGSGAKLADVIRASGGRIIIKVYPDIGHLGPLLELSGLVELHSKVAADMAHFADL